MATALGTQRHLIAASLDFGREVTGGWRDNLSAPSSPIFYYRRDNPPDTLRALQSSDN